MKLKREELLEKIKNYVGDRTDDESIEIIEDISDSFEESDTVEDVEKIKAEYETKLANLDSEWRKKYKARFFSKDENEENREDEEEEEEEVSEKTDYSDLFEKED